jgi:acetyltransferase-like isoleucine patch superfamily enzyme
MSGRPVQHLQFHQSASLRTALRVLGILSWPISLPLGLLGRMSDEIFRTLSELLALLPYLIGVVVRREFYRFALQSCGENLVVEFGAVFLHRDVTIGDHCLIGRYSIVHHCDFGDYVVTGERCTFLHGGHYHHHDRLDVPMAQQGGTIEPIAIGTDCWVGAHAVVMAPVANGAIVGAGSVVTHPVAERHVVAGNPARTLRVRGAAEVD